jgi:hypothetical protein
MTRHTLCEGGLAVHLSGKGNLATLLVVDGVTARFDCHTHLLRAVLDGAPLQVSAKEGFCLLERRGSIIKLEFGIAGEGRQSCDFPTDDFATALDEIERS